MKYFRQTGTTVNIIHDNLTFTCSSARFQVLEPDYPGLLGSSERYWTPERAYLKGMAYDGHDCGVYCDRIVTYTTHPVIFADVVLSKEDIHALNPSDAIQFSARLKDGNGNLLPVTYDWFVRLTHEEEGDIDRILLDFVDGECSKTYTFLPGNPLGTWFIDESKFDLVTVGGVDYQVKLIQPVSFVAYREL